MDLVLRAAIVYLLLMIVFRVAGRRTFADMTTFDFVLLLIISEAVQQGLIGDDLSITGAFLVISTLVMIDVGLSLLKRASPKVAELIDGVPTILVKNGKALKDRIFQARLDEEDILQSARCKQGISSMEGIKHAILETNGGISIIPNDNAKP